MKLEFPGPDGGRGEAEWAVSVGGKRQRGEKGEGRKWGHPERTALPTPPREGEVAGGAVGGGQDGGEAGSQAEAGGGSWHHLLAAALPQGRGWGAPAFPAGAGLGGCAVGIPGRKVIRDLPAPPLPLPSPRESTQRGFLACGQGQPGLPQPGRGSWGPARGAPGPEEALPWLGTETESARREAGKCGRLL